MRADGIGDWASALQEVLTGTASQQLADSFAESRRAFTQRLGEGEWQYQTVSDLNDVLVGVHEGTEPIANKVALSTWFQIFIRLRNKTRGHGALTGAKCARLVPKLESSIKNICENNPIFSSCGSGQND